MQEFKNLLIEKYVKYFNAKPAPGFVEACAAHYELLVKYNEMFNLTRITGVEESVLLHYIDSVFIEASAAGEGVFSDGSIIADIGTGGGFPAFPLFFHLVHNLGKKDIKMTLFESSVKKTDFLKICVQALGIEKSVRCENMRLEDAGIEPKYREKFNIVTARALASLPVLLEYAVPLMKVTGAGLFMKGEDIEAEKTSASKAVKVLNARYIKDFVYELEGMQYKRRVLIIGKTGQTPKKYPRKSGIPKKMPLI